MCAPRQRGALSQELGLLRALATVTSASVTPFQQDKTDRKHVLSMSGSKKEVLTYRK